MTERKDDRQLRLAGPGDWPSERLVELSTNVMTGPEFTDSVKLIDEAIGESLPQGSLFAYLFRRFGFRQCHRLRIDRRHGPPSREIRARH